jgi:hypothetical protein
MIPRPLRRLRLARTCVQALLIVSLTASRSAAQQVDSPELRITSPPDGTVVNPGQTVAVVVTPATGRTLAQVSIVGQDPIGLTPAISAPPFQFAISVLPGSSIRKYRLTAWAIDGRGQTVVSMPITINVESAVDPVAMRAQPTSLYLEAQGQRHPLAITATFPDGTVADITESSNVVYSSSDTKVVSVDTSGVVTAVGPGSASVTATYGPSSSGVRVSVPVTILPPILISSPSALSFGNELIGTSGPSKILTLTNNTTGAIRVTNLRTNGDFSETDDCVSSSPIVAGGTCTVDVTFTPTGPGARAAVLAVTNNLNVVPVAIPVGGTGEYSFKWIIGTAAPALNSAEVGDGYRVAFSLGGNFGLNAVTSLTSTSISCSGPRGGELPEAEGRPGLSYNAATRNYQVAFAKAGAQAAGTCAQISLTLNDGTTETIDIKYVR